ncbi:MAG: hypothetical protein R3D26_07890 [Cyanobacteriota/Melainabacteria group bacterium]
MQFGNKMGLDQSIRRMVVAWSLPLVLVIQQGIEKVGALESAKSFFGEKEYIHHRL